MTDWQPHVTPQVGIYWSIGNFCPLNPRGEALVKTEERVDRLLTNLFRLIRANGIEPCREHMVATTRGTWNQKLMQLVQTYGFRITTPLWPPLSGQIESELINNLQAVSLDRFPPVSIFLTFGRPTRSLTAIVQKLRFYYQRQVWIVDRERWLYTAAAAITDKLVSVEELLQESIPNNGFPICPKGLSPVAVYWDIENFINIRQPTERNRQHIADIAHALYRCLLANQLMPTGPHLLVAAQDFLSSEVRQELKSKGFITRLTPLRQPDAAERVLMKAASCALKTNRSSETLPQHVVILSGDGRLSMLIKQLQESKREVWVVSRQHDASRILRHMADRFISVEELLS